MLKRVLEINVDDLHAGGVFSLVKNVIQHKKSNIKIDIAAIEKFENPNNIKILSEYGSSVYYIGYSGNKWKKQVVCYCNLKSLIKEKRYDCVHIHADVANKLLVSGLAAKRVGVKKIILHSHAAGVDGNHRGLKLLFHKVCRRLLKYIGTDFVACSDLAAQWMFPNISQDKICIINNGVDLDKFRYNIEIREKVRRELGITDELLIGHVGRFAYQKNHEFLVKIMKSVKARKLNAKLLLVGEGPDENKIRKLVTENYLDDCVIFYGTSSKVNELFQAMDVFVLPSHFEGLPIVGVEAQASGLSIIFSDKITKEAKLTELVSFISISDSSVIKWVIQIMEYVKYDRRDQYLNLEKRRFSIYDTIRDFLDLYS